MYRKRINEYIKPAYVPPGYGILLFRSTYCRRRLFCWLRCAVRLCVCECVWPLIFPLNESCRAHKRITLRILSTTTMTTMNDSYFYLLLRTELRDMPSNIIFVAYKMRFRGCEDEENRTPMYVLYVVRVVRRQRWPKRRCVCLSCHTLHIFVGMGGGLFGSSYLDTRVIYLEAEFYGRIKCFCVPIDLGFFLFSLSLALLLFRRENAFKTLLVLRTLYTM